MTLELVPWKGAQVPVLNGNAEISRYSLSDLAAWASSMRFDGHTYGLGQYPVTTYGKRPSEPIGNSFSAYVEGMLYRDGTVAAVEWTRLRVFSQAPLLFQERKDGRPGDFYDDEALDLLRRPWPGGTTSDLLKRALMYADFGGNAYIVVVDDELVVLRPDWVEIVLAERMVRGQQVGFKQIGIAYYEGGPHTGEAAYFARGEYCHFAPMPDPLACYRGMSWLTPVIREIQSNIGANTHARAWFENAATPNLAVSLPKEITPQQFGEFVAKMDAQHKGAANAYKTLYTAGGADVSVIGADMKQMDFTGVQGKLETRIANAAGVHPVIVGLSEGMQGSSLNAGNYAAAKRNFVDTTARDLWQNWCGSLEVLFPPPAPGARLWYDGRDIPFLHEDAKDIAQIQQTQQATITGYVMQGFKAESAVAAVIADDPSLLEHSGLVSVQLLPPGQQPGAPEEGAEEYAEELEAARAAFPADEIERRFYGSAPGERVGKGKVGGGRFKKLSDRALDAIREFFDSDADGDPLDGWTQPQLKKAAEQMGIDVAPRTSGAKLKLAILKHARGDKGEHSKPGAPEAKAPAKKADIAVDEAVERLGSVSSESEAIALLAGDQRLTSSKLRRVAEALGIDVPEDMRAKSSIQMHIAERVGRAGGKPDSVEQARQRQADIDTARTYGDLAAELDELFNNEVSAKTLASRIDNFGARHPELADELAPIRDADPGDAHRLARELAESHGVKITGRAGDVVPLDRKLHAPIDNTLSGGNVEIIRPGYEITLPSGEVVKVRAKVDRADGPPTSNPHSDDPDFLDANVAEQTSGIEREVQGEGSARAKTARIRARMKRLNLHPEGEGADLHYVWRRPGGDVDLSDTSPTTDREILAARQLAAAAVDAERSLLEHKRVGGTPSRARGDIAADIDAYTGILGADTGSAKKTLGRLADERLAGLDTEDLRDTLDLKSVDQLKDMIRDRNKNGAKIKLSGRKRELVDRLVEHDMPSGPTTDNPAVGVPTVRPSGLPADRKPESGDFDDLADRVKGKPEAQILEILQDLSATELARLARKFSGSRGGGGLGGSQYKPKGIAIPTNLTLDERRMWLAQRLTAPGWSWRSEAFDEDEIERADEDHPDDELIRAMDDNALKHYWTTGEGLKRWRGHPHPWTRLRNLLRKHVGPGRAERMASEWFRLVFGYWPGHRKGENPVGPG